MGIAKHTAPLFGIVRGLENPLVEPASRFEPIRIPLEKPIRKLESLSGILGIPEWWPTGSRIGIAIAHASGRDLDDPVIAGIHRGLTERRYLSLRFNFPFSERGRRRPDPEADLLRAFRAAVAVLGRDPNSAPARLFVGGMGLGGLVAALASTRRIQVEGVFALSYPLHARDDPKRKVREEPLFQIVNPLLFVQGTRDRYCNPEALRQTLRRVGAPKTLYLVADADHAFELPKSRVRSQGHVVAHLVDCIDRWCTRVLES